MQRLSVFRIFGRIGFVTALLTLQLSAVGAHVDSTSDSTASRRDSVHVLPEVHRVKIPPESERLVVLGTGLAIIAGFIVLLTLKKREADRTAEKN
jgi:hypothetical protein